MRSYIIKLPTVELVKKFTNLTLSIDGDITIKSDRWAVDGKSIMGIMSLDLSKEVCCELVSSSEEQFEAFEKGLRELSII